MSDANEHDAFKNALESEQDALAGVLEELLHNAAMAIAQGRATPKMLKSALIEQGFSPQQTKDIVTQATAIAHHAVKRAKQARRSSQYDEPPYLREFRRQANAVSDREFIQSGVVALVFVAVFLVFFGDHVHGRGQGLVIGLILIAIGAIVFGLFGRIRDTLSRILNR